MALSSEFYHLMSEYITVYPESSADKYGKKSFSATGTQIRCRIMNATKAVRDRDGREVFPEGQIICYGAFPNITVNHKLVLPDGRTMPILTVSNIKDETEQDYYTSITFDRG